MHDITITFKNCSPKVEAMVWTTFKRAPTQVTGKSLEENPDNLTIDFNDGKDQTVTTIRCSCGWVGEGKDLALDDDRAQPIEVCPNCGESPDPF